MRILIIGSGGREHALAWKIKQSPLCTALFCAPGNAGTASLATNLPVKPLDFKGLKQAVLTEHIDMVIVGPDDPLGEGIVDFFQEEKQLEDILILGPTAAGARLESSKSFAKAFMKRHDIPTAAYEVFSKEEREKAAAYLATAKLPVVLKADGLAAGKGVVICHTRQEGLDFLKEVWDDNRFGEAGSKIVAEEFLTGTELSVFILTDGKRYVLLPEAKDYKRIGEGDTGPNTGGMGSVSPVPFAGHVFMEKVKRRIIAPTLYGLQKDHIPYRGFIFFGLINVSGNPYVIEYNARMGDPETQVVLPRITSDLLPLFIEAAEGKLEDAILEIDARWAAAVIPVSKGYPGKAESGKAISGLEHKGDSLVFHAGTAMDGDQLLTAGGRVLAITSLAPTLEKAIDLSYEAVGKMYFDGMYYRKDIGKDMLELL